MSINLNQYLTPNPQPLKYATYTGYKVEGPIGRIVNFQLSNFVFIAGGIYLPQECADALAGAEYIKNPSDTGDVIVQLPNELAGGGTGSGDMLKSTYDTNGNGYVDDADYVRNGYSSRFGATINVSRMSQALDAIFQFTYINPSVTLSAGTPGGLYEIGTIIPTLNLSAVTTRSYNPRRNITSVVFKRGGATDHTVASPIALGGTETWNGTDPITDDVSFQATVGDGTGSGNSNTISYQFVYPFYYGVGAQALLDEDIQALTKIVKAKSDTTTVTSPTMEVYYLAYPASYGVLTSILDQNNFETIDDYTLRTSDFTMMDASVVTYNIYEFNNLTTQVNFSNSFKF